MSLASMILASQAWAAINHANPHLELTAKVLMGWNTWTTTEVKDFGSFWRTEYRDKCEIKTGVFKRAPKDETGYTAYLHTYSLSRDELLGIVIASHLFDLGETARRILDEGTTFGLYLSGFVPIKPISGKWYAGIVNFLGRHIDSEWFILWHPVYRAYVKLAAGRELNSVETWAIQVDLATSTTWNLLDLKLLFLSLLDKREFNQHIVKARQRMGTKYRDRYGSNPIYLQLWELRDGNNQ